MDKKNEVVINSINLNADVHLDKTFLISVLVVVQSCMLPWGHWKTTQLIHTLTGIATPNSGTGYRGSNHTLRSIPSLHSERLLEVSL